MLIDKKITEKIAKLAKIKLSEEDIDEYSKDLSKILTWIDKLKEVDVSETEPVTSVNNTKLQERKDELLLKLMDKKNLLSNAPEKNEDYFKVPKVID
tara:strand:+ start:98 stop:388 length:291 start_codon:yes stop_codon:yes gene_type:complete